MYILADFFPSPQSANQKKVLKKSYTNDRGENYEKILGRVSECLLEAVKSSTNA
jgi:hypothetical protein